MPRVWRLLSVVAALTVTVACGETPNPFGVNRIPTNDPIFHALESRQRYWCERITGETCLVYLSSVHPEYAAWVDWRLSSPAVFWNERVLTDRQFWITDPRMAHEACHLRHGWHPEWSPQKTEEFADQCALQYTGAAP